MDSFKRHTAIVALIIWLVLLLLFWPASPLSLDYVRVILVAAPLLIVPFCVEEQGVSSWQILFFAVPFALGMLIEASWWATIAVAPWWLFSVWLLMRVWKRMNDWSLAELMLLAERFFLFTAACWAMADRLELQPLDFSADIVLLTAVHFHYAGFALVWLTNKLGTGPDWMRWGIISGVGLVAIGITGSQLNFPVWIEVVSVTILVVAALRLAIALFLSAKGKQRLPLYFAAVALSFGMLLALCYGWRYYFPISTLNIPVMYALHGSLNSLGFALPATWAFLLESRRFE